jgi:hypothetical protein
VWLWHQKRTQQARDETSKQAINSHCDPQLYFNFQQIIIKRDHHTVAYSGATQQGVLYLAFAFLLSVLFLSYAASKESLETKEKEFFFFCADETSCFSECLWSFEVFILFRSDYNNF